MDWVFVENKYCPSLTNFDDKVIEIDGIHDKNGTLIFDRFPKISLEIIDKTQEYTEVEATITYENNIYNKEVTMFIESDEGYIPKRRMTFTGKTKFKVYNQGLSSGDIITVRAGYKHWKNISKIEIYV